MVRHEIGVVWRESFCVQILRAKEVIVFGKVLGFDFHHLGRRDLPELLRNVDSLLWQ